MEFARLIRSKFWLMAVCLLMGSGSQAAFDKAGVLGVGARATGMGDAFTAISNEALSASWNPAGLTQLRRYEIEGFLGPLLNGKEYYMAGGIGMPFMGAAMGLNFVTLYHNTGDSRTDAFENTFILTGATPLNIERTVSVGLNLKFLQYSSNAHADITTTGQTLLAQASSLGIDVGFLYQLPLPQWGKRLSLGFFAQDIDTVLHWQSGSEERVPLLLQLGAAYWLEENLVAAIDFSFLNDTNISGQPLGTAVYDAKGKTITALESMQYRPHLGLEGWFFNDHLGLRSGYTGFATTQGRFTAGVSYKDIDFGIDYAYIGHAEHLGDSHRLSASYYFGQENAAARVVALVFPPSGVKTASDNNAVELTWDVNPDPHVTGYTVYMSKSSGVGYSAVAKKIRENKVKIEGLSNGARYYFVVASVNNSWPAVESNYSQEVAATPGPQIPGQLGAQVQSGPNTSGSFICRGLPPPLGSTKGYIIYYSKTSGMGFVAFNTKDKLFTDQANVVVTGVEPNTDYFWKAAGVSPSGIEGPTGAQEVQVHSSAGQ